MSQGNFWGGPYCPHHQKPQPPKRDRLKAFIRYGFEFKHRRLRFAPIGGLRNHRINNIYCDHQNFLYRLPLDGEEISYSLALTPSRRSHLPPPPLGEACRPNFAISWPSPTRSSKRKTWLS